MGNNRKAPTMPKPQGSPKALKTPPPALEPDYVSPPVQESHKPDVPAEARPDTRPDTQYPEPSTTKKVVPVNKGIEVLTLRSGFYKQCRYELGDTFFVPEMRLVGTWMKCTDPVAEKKHQELMKLKKDANPRRTF